MARKKEEQQIQEQIKLLQQRLVELKDEGRTPLGRNLRRLRAEKGVRQEDLAEAIGVSRVQIVNIENGNAYTTIPNLLKLCEVLKVTPNDLLLEN